jgi:RNA polymerase sigma-70 factor (ECF subfamily)
MDEEERLGIIGSQDGDPAAFEILVRTHQRMIHALTFRMTGSQADAEDLAQETFIQAYQQIGRFRGEASFSSWLYRIGVNTCLNWRKRESRRRQLHEHWEPPGEEMTPVDDRVGRQVQAALMKLHPKQRAAVVLTLYDGYSHAEAGRLLGCSETTVSWRVFAARKKLKRWLADMKAEDEEL